MYFMMAMSLSACALSIAVLQKTPVTSAIDDDVDNDAARTCPQPQRRPEAIARIEWRWF